LLPLLLKDEKLFFNFLRMDKAAFDILLELIEPNFEILN
jgi:hypothetical protein